MKSFIWLTGFFAFVVLLGYTFDRDFGAGFVLLFPFMAFMYAFSQEV